MSSFPVILCVDDEEIILESLGEELARAVGNLYDIELAQSGLDALAIAEQLQAEGIDLTLVISDQMMPGMTGDELLTEIHRLLPETMTILLTGQSRLEDVRKALNQANLYRYITKPWDSTDLMLTVQEAVRSYEQKRQLLQQRVALQESNVNLQKNLSLLQATLEAAVDGILVLDYAANITHYNLNLLKLLGIETESLKEETFPTQNIQSITQIKQTITHLFESWNNFLLEAKQQPQNGKVKQIELNHRILECYVQNQYFGHQSVGFVWSFRDVTERHQAATQIQYQANHDVLTSLPNRRYFNQKIKQILDLSAQQDNAFAILFIDLDRFKVVNDTLGHSVGDELLLEVVQRLKICCRSQDILSRWGGDEFTIILPNMSAPEDIRRVARKLLDALRPSMLVQGYELHVTASIGIAIYPQDGDTPETLLKHADTALFQVKDSGRDGIRFYLPGSHEYSPERLSLENGLYQALERNEFCLHYQPQLDLRTGEVNHAEALIRWNHPSFGFLAAGRFIPIAEKTSLMQSIERWVLRRACLQIQQWQEAGLPPITVSVNLSAMQFQNPNLVEEVEQILAQTGINPRFLELEITESIALQDMDFTADTLKTLNGLGIDFALDDFGTGFASLSYLRKLPFQTLKMDRSFVKDLLENKKDLAIVKAILAMGRDLNLRVVAEGIETLELKEHLTALGCQYLQGYWFSRPLPANELVSLIQGQQQPQSDGYTPLKIAA